MVCHVLPLTADVWLFTGNGVVLRTVVGFCYGALSWVWSGVAFGDGFDIFVG